MREEPSNAQVRRVDPALSVAVPPVTPPPN
jgi:hypothetical protein